MADILDEIKQDIKEERFERSLVKYGPFFLIISLLIVATVAIYNFYKDYQEDFSLETGAVFYDAFQDNDFEKYQQASQSGHEGYQILADLNQAALRYSREEYDEAVKSLVNITEERSYDKVYREASELAKVHIMIEQNAEYQDIISILDRLTLPETVFTNTAKEIKALYLINSDNKAEGLKILEELAFNDKVSQSARDRANKYLKLYK
jgi:hypothetical protein